MPDRTPCEKCGRIGFVRREHVIRQGHASLEFYCGACDHTWQRDETADASKELRNRGGGSGPVRSKR